MFGMPIGVLLIAYAPWLLALGGAFYLGLRAVRALERRAGSRKELDEAQERLLRLEESVAGLAEHVTRLADGQEFTTRLLSERQSR